MPFYNPFGMFDPPEKEKMPTAEAVPDNDPNSPVERAKLGDLTIGEKGRPCAHETAAVIRMHRAGFTSPQIQQTLGMSPHEVKHEFQLGLDLEGAAHRLGLPIHDARVPKPPK